MRAVILRGSVLAVVIGLLLASPAGAGEAQGPAGAWNVEWTDGGGQHQTGTLTLAIEGSKVTGTLESPSGISGPLEGTVEGSSLEFALDLTTPEGPSTIPCKAEVKGDAIAGTAVDGGNTIPWTGKRAVPETE